MQPLRRIQSVLNTARREPSNTVRPSRTMAGRVIAENPASVWEVMNDVWLTGNYGVNLTDGTIKKEAHARRMPRCTQPGACHKIMMDEVDPKVDPLSEENKLIFMTGPLIDLASAAAGMK